MGHRKKLAFNFISLSALQGMNYLLPLITVPYLVRVLGPEKFGLVAFAQAFMQYFVLFTDFGFNFSATRRISIHKNNKEEINRIFSAVFWLKAIFMLISFCVMALMIASFSKFRIEAAFYFINFGVVVGNALFFSWFFQGMEKMAYITGLNLVTKLIFLSSIFYFVRSPADYKYMAALYSAGYLVAGLLSMWISFKDFHISLKLPDYDQMRTEYLNAYHVFTGQLATTLYTTSNAFILGLLTNYTLVGYYSSAEKIVKALQALFTPVSQTIFPHISELASQSRDAALVFVRKITVLTAIGFFAISVGTFMFADKLVLLILGEKYLMAIPVIKLLSFLPFICNLSNIFGTQVLINFGRASDYSRVSIIAGVLNVPIAVFAALAYSQKGIALTTVGVETFITVALYWMMLRRRLFMFNEGVFVGRFFKGG